MKKTRLFGLSAIILASIFSSCDLSYFDNDIEDFTWEGGVNLPVGHATYTLSELFDELEVEELDEDTNGNFSFTYTESINGGDDSAFDVSIEDVTITSSVATPVTASDISPATFPVTLPDPLPAALAGGKSDDNQVVYDLGLTQELTGASFSNGTMVITFTSTFQAANAVLTMSIPSFTKKTDDSEYVGTVTLNGAGSQNLTINLNEYNANFTHDGTAFDATVNRVVLNMSSVFTFISGQDLTAADNISYSAVLSGASTDVVYGDFKQEPFSVDNNTIDLDFFNDFGDGITFEDASMTIAATNGFGFPIGIDVSGIAGDKGVGTTSTALTYTSVDADELTAGSDYIIFDGITTYSAGAAAVVTSTTLDKDNSNINALLSSAPTRFNLNVSGKANPVLAGTNENFYATTNDGLSVDVTVDVPLTVKFTDVTISQDDIELDLGEDIDDLNELSIDVTTVNNIPLSGSIDLIFKENGTANGLTKSIPIFEAAPTDATGKSNGSTNTTNTINFTFSEMELLKQATEVGLDITFNSGTEAVKLNGSDTIKLILNAVVDVEITGDDEENN
ncbi:hypothetical protein [Flavicella sp.]|uniref:hypothetical protein n=1 Tax=Flavicella sp. TaxID=2957742 RepID=UPI002610D68D|nr:hypothetical protein [Flavicella sp.]MDG1805109.1 hypothetical protein [Flavicella sp.]